MATAMEGDGYVREVVLIVALWLLAMLLGGLALLFFGDTLRQIFASVAV